MAGIRATLGSLGDDPGLGVRLKGLKVGEEDEESEIDEEELEQIEESIVERLVGLTEMVPDPWWNFGKRAFSFSYWLVGRSAWVLGTSLAILWFPAFIEQQRIEMVTMQDMQTKQLMLGQGAPTRSPIPVPRSM